MLEVSKKTTNKWQQRAAHSPGLKYNWLMLPEGVFYEHRDVITSQNI